MCETKAYKRLRLKFKGYIPKTRFVHEQNLMVNHTMSHNKLIEHLQKCYEKNFLPKRIE